MVCSGSSHSPFATWYSWRKIPVYSLKGDWLRSQVRTKDDDRTGSIEAVKTASHMYAAMYHDKVIRGKMQKLECSRSQDR